MTIRLPEEMAEQLREKARRTGMPVGRVVRQFVETGLSRLSGREPQIPLPVLSGALALSLERELR